jgi:hypothetical protein
MTGFKATDRIFLILLAILTGFYIFAIISNWVHQHVWIWTLVPVSLILSVIIGLGFLMYWGRRNNLE